MKRFIIFLAFLLCFLTASSSFSGFGFRLGIRLSDTIGGSGSGSGPAPDYALIGSNGIAIKGADSNYIIVFH